MKSYDRASAAEHLVPCEVVLWTRHSDQASEVGLLEMLGILLQASFLVYGAEQLHAAVPD